MVPITRWIAEAESWANNKTIVYMDQHTQLKDSLT